ncbi:MAG: hypothetical protein KF846_13945 [Cyclobacteriaceae bacterium]|nr:hypothetical protein [Cyclobacteriaceae bacterium]
MFHPDFSGECRCPGSLWMMKIELLKANAKKKLFMKIGLGPDTKARPTGASQAMRVGFYFQ